MTDAKQAAQGCSCEQFQDALARGFVSASEGSFSLADLKQEAPGSAWTTEYGPNIAFCPFCGSALNPK